MSNKDQLKNKKETESSDTLPYVSPRSRIPVLFQCISIALALIAAVEYFKYGTRINYEWFHCTAISESVDTSSSVLQLWARGGPSCDKRGEFKTIMKRITRDYEPNEEHLQFCIIENMDVNPIHYPIDENKGAPGYIAYVGYDHDQSIVEDLCKDATIFHM